jgi:hypothetical protein
VLVLNGCDDGDLIQEDINFQDIATTSCTTNDIIFKLKKRSILLEIPKFFVNEPSLTDAPTTIDINNSNRVVYRFTMVSYQPIISNNSTR